jgi:hypothetical protein
MDPLRPRSPHAGHLPTTPPPSPGSQARVQEANTSSTPGLAPEGLSSRRPAPGGDAALRPRLSAIADQLSARTHALSLGEASPRDSMDDLDIRVAVPPLPDRAQRMESVAQRVAAVASAQETLARRIDAQTQEVHARRAEYRLPAAPFGALFEANADNRSSRFKPLRQAAQDHLDAARQWREAVPLHEVALGAAQRFGVEDVRRTATEAIGFCEAKAARLEMVGQMLTALSTSRLGLSAAEGGNFRSLELSTTALHAVIEKGRVHGFQALQDAGFEPQLRQMAEDAGAQLKRAGAAHDSSLAVLVPQAFRAASQVPVWQARTAAAALELVQVAESLLAAMQGDAQAIESPAAPLPALLMAATKAEERACRQKPAQDFGEALGAWFSALEAHVDLPDALAQASARVTVDALQAQAVQTLQQHVDQGLARTQAQVRGILETAVDALHADLRAADAAGDSDLHGLEAAAHGIAQRAGQLQALVSSAPVLQRPALKQSLPAQTLAQPFAVLQQAAQAVAAAAAGFGTAEAAALKRAASAAQAAASAPGTLAAKPMGELAAFCNQLARDVMMAPAEVEHERAKEFLVQVNQAALPAGRRLEALLNGLQDLPALHSPPAVPATPHPGQFEARLHIDRMQAVARHAQALTALAALPDGAPPQALATQRATRLMLRATSVAASAVAESLSICQQALDELPRAAPHQRSALAQALAERSRTTGTTVAGALAEQIDFNTDGLPEHLVRVVNEQGARLRHTERLAQRVRVPLQAMALMSAAQRDADAFQEAARGLPPSQAAARIGELGRQYAQAEAVLKAGAQQLVTKIMADKASANAGASPLLDLEAMAVMRSFNDLGLRAGRERELARGRLLVDLVQRTLAHPEQAKTMDRAGMSQVVEQVQKQLLQGGSAIEKHLREPGQGDAARPLLERVTGMVRELEACGAQLATAPAAKAAASSSRTSRRR